MSDEGIVIERDSAKLLLSVLTQKRSHNKQVEFNQTVVDALAKIVSRGLGESSETISPKSRAMKARFERFFDVIVQVQAPPPAPYSVEEVIAHATETANDYLVRAEEAQNDPEYGDLGKLYRSESADYRRMAHVASSEGLEAALALYNRFDTATRENFGGKDFDEARWCVTLDRNWF